MERLITLNLRRYLVRQHRNKRVRKAAPYVRERVAHYTKLDSGAVSLTRELNNKIVSYYAKRMAPLKLKVDIKEGAATADLFRERKAEAAPPLKGQEQKKSTGKKEDAKAEGKGK